MSTDWMRRYDRAEIPLSPEEEFQVQQEQVAARTQIESDDHVATGDGEKPWWLPWQTPNSTVLPGKMDVTEALSYSGLADWDLKKVPIHVEIPTGYGEEKVVVPRHYAVQRTGTDHKVLGVVGPGYHIVQNERAFDWAQALLGGESVERSAAGFGESAYFTSAGSLKGGRVVFLVAKTPFTTTVAKGDDLETYLLIMNRHDGGGAVTCAIVTIRVVCANTLERSIAGALATYKVRHTLRAGDYMDQAREVLGLARGASQRSLAAAQALAAKSVDVSDFLAKLLPVETEEITPRALAAIMKRRGQIEEVYNDHPTLNGLSGAWRAYNAVTFVTDHLAGRKRSPDPDSSPDDHRMLDLIGGGNLGTRAYELLDGPRW